MSTKVFHRNSLQTHKEAKKAFANQIPEICYLKSLQTHKESKQTFARKHNQAHQSDGEYYHTIIMLRPLLEVKPIHHKRLLNGLG